MPVGMWKVDDTPITPYTTTIRRLEARQVWHATLDGQPHVQTIGEPVEIVDVELWTYKAGKDLLDYCQATGTPVKVSDGAEIWVGVIAEGPAWEKVNRTLGIFRTELSIKALAPE